MHGQRALQRTLGPVRVGAGEEFRGEGILAITKALLQSGVSYVGGYQGSPISHLMDVLADANDILDELGLEVAGICTHLDQALKLVDEVVAEFLAEGISDREMSDLTEQAAAGFQVALRTDAAVASTLSQFTFLGIDLSELDNYSQRVKAVTKEEVNEAIRKYLRLDEATTVVCGTF